MEDFNDALHTLKLSEDGSYTAYSKEYDEHYHSTKDGALAESLNKHVIPASSLIEQDEITILDICYGLGFNTLTTLLYFQEHFPNKKLNIYSPELDSSLVASLVHFTYPKEFEVFKEIIKAISKDGFYRDEKIYIEVYLGDAREYVKRFKNKFDVVYQDAFSPSTNPILWTKEYFSDIKDAMKKSGVLTTYSIALKTRLALYENGFNIYLNSGENFRASTIASKRVLEGLELVNMEHKIAYNKEVKPLSDRDIR